MGVAMSATTKNFEQGKDEVAKLCEYFARNKATFLAPGMKEAHVRQNLIDPFFRALGWDVGNAARVAPQYCEVVVEDSLDVEGQQKAPDYTYRVGTLPKFYVEAKKCGANIFADPAPAYQLRRYGWSAKVAVSILTDFEELGVYDCTKRPRPADKASHARILYYRFDEYPDRWRELWDIFSREAVWSGAFDQYAASKRKRGTSEVDVEFLKEIEGWRDELARNIALRNADLSGDELNRAVQSTIDRIVFLRMAEDRGLEPCDQLLTICEQGDIYQSYMKLCRKADDKYNSGLFHFQKEPGVPEPPDRITPKLTVDDRVLKPILQSLYFAHGSPYEFKVLPVEILGTVYERFLGKVIRLTAGHQAKVEEKPEVRKAGGVYYTPAYIVDYIVRQTVGRQIEGKSPAQLAGKRNGKQPLRILDMACGSGSFLLGAYKCLLEHHAKWYAEHNPKRYKSAIYRDTRSGDWRLTITEKKRILTSHIFGVDIDPQAVEVSKLSLLLKVLEGESAESVGNTMRLFHERALPNLSDNIKCGNSLVGPDFFAGKLIRDPEEFTSVNAFDWQREFPAAMKAGGFDCLIGNPPYVLLQDTNRDCDQLDYFRAKYQVASYKLDTYHLFIERAVQLAKAGGNVSMITPANFIANNHLDKLRKHLLNHSKIDHILVIDGGVFPKASVDNAVFVLTKATAGTSTFRVIHAAASDPILTIKGTSTIRAADVMADPFALFTGGSVGAFSILCRRMEEINLTLGQVAKVNFGKQLRDRAIHTRDVIEVASAASLPRSYKPCYTGKDITRYGLKWGKMACLDSEVARCGGCWDPDAQNAKHKLLTRQIGQYPSFALDEKGYQCLNVLFMVNILEGGPDVAYLLGILNSRLMRFYWMERYNDRRRTFPKIKGTYLKKLPIRLPHADSETDAASAKRMASLVRSMISMHKQLALAKGEAQRGAIQRQIEATDAAIDRLVYDLYGLTKEEIAIVEGVNQSRVTNE
jgi:hypothetical protein